MNMRLIESLATTPALAELFSDESVLGAMLDFEAALARAEARAGVIPQDAGPRRLQPWRSLAVSMLARSLWPPSAREPLPSPW